jgi:hypothetical protein
MRARRHVKLTSGPNRAETALSWVADATEQMRADVGELVELS